MIEKILNPKKFKKWVEKNIGKHRCKDYCWDCFICRSWRLYDEIESYVWFNDALLDDNKLNGKRVRPHKS